MAERDADVADLLKPSLSGGIPVAPLYSVGVGYVLSLVGPFAVGTIMAINAHRLGRLAKDAWIFVIVFAVATALPLAFVLDPSLFQIDLNGDEVSFRWALTIGTGLAIMGLLYLRYRRYYRVMMLSGIDSPSPWKMGICVFIGSYYLNSALIRLFTFLES